MKRFTSHFIRRWAVAGSMSVVFFAARAQANKMPATPESGSSSEQHDSPNGHKDMGDRWWEPIKVSWYTAPDCPTTTTTNREFAPSTDVNGNNSDRHDAPDSNVTLILVAAGTVSLGAYRKYLLKR